MEPREQRRRWRKPASEAGTKAALRKGSLLGFHLATVFGTQEQTFRVPNMIISLLVTCQPFLE